MYRSIAISGSIASGTSTAAKVLAEKLNLKYVSAGNFFRNYATKNNIPLYAKDQVPDKLDQKIDRELGAKAQKEEVVIDAHYIGYFTKDMPNVLRVLLYCDYQIRIERALRRIHTHEESEEEIKLREEGLDKKFRKLYADENFLDPKFFDLVIDTTNTTPAEVVDRISKKFKR